MQTQELFNEILSEVINITGISPKDLNKGNELHKVEARIALVDTLSSLGLRDSAIAHLTGINLKTVNRYHNSAYQRKKQSFSLRAICYELNKKIPYITQKYPICSSYLSHK